MQKRRSSNNSISVTTTTSTNNNSNNRQRCSSAPSSQIVGIDRKFLECGLCADLLVEPRRLPCSHVFCTSCLLEVRNATLNGDNDNNAACYTNRAYFLRCPQCQQQNAGPVERMMVDHLMKDMVESVRTQAVQQFAVKSSQFRFVRMPNRFDPLDADGNVTILDGTLTCNQNAYKGSVQAFAKHGYSYAAADAACVPADRCVLHFWEVEILTKRWNANVSIRFGEQQFTCGLQTSYWESVRERLPDVTRFGTGDFVGVGLVLPSRNSAGNNNKLCGWTFFTVNGSIVEHRALSLENLPVKASVWMHGKGTRVAVNFGERPFSFDVRQLVFCFPLMQ